MKIYKINQSELDAFAKEWFKSKRFDMYAVIDGCYNNLIEHNSSPYFHQDNPKNYTWQDFCPLFDYLCKFQLDEDQHWTSLAPGTDLETAYVNSAAATVIEAEAEDDYIYERWEITLDDTPERGVNRCEKLDGYYSTSYVTLYLDITVYAIDRALARCDYFTAGIIVAFLNTINLLDGMMYQADDVYMYRYNNAIEEVDKLVHDLSLDTNTVAQDIIAEINRKYQ